VPPARRAPFRAASPSGRRTERDGALSPRSSGRNSAGKRRREVSVCLSVCPCLHPLLRAPSSPPRSAAAAPCAAVADGFRAAAEPPVRATGKAGCWGRGRAGCQWRSCRVLLLAAPPLPSPSLPSPMPCACLSRICRANGPCHCRPEADGWHGHGQGAGAGTWHPSFTRCPVLSCLVPVLLLRCSALLRCSLPPAKTARQGRRAEQR
jgi:hypothetical protein